MRGPSHHRGRRIREAVLVIVSLGMLSVVANWWVLDGGNFFGLDDFDWFRQIQTRDDGFFTWLPGSVYNDRPVGAIVLRTIWNLFGWNHVAHHACLWTIHLVNACLVYMFAGWLLRAMDRLPDRPRFTAWLAAAVFVAWPTSTMAPSEDASIFDLVGGTFLAAFLALAVAPLPTALTMVRAPALLAILWLGLRTKEMLIVAPFCLALVVLADAIVARWRRERPALPALGWTTAGLCLVAVSYYVLLKMVDDGYGKTPDHPYFLSFTPSVILTNAARYVALFFDFGTPASEAHWPTGSRWLYYVLPGALIAVGGWQVLNRRNMTILLCSLAALLQVAPVLPMQNMHQRLYLYLPSVFAAIAIAAVVAALLARLPGRRGVAEGGAATLLIGGMLWGAYGADLSISRYWWLEIGRENLKVFPQVRALPPFPEGARVAVVNVPDYMIQVTLVAPGRGEILRILGSHPSIDVKVYEHEVPASEPGAPPTHVIDYNGGQLTVRRQ